MPTMPSPTAPEFAVRSLFCLLAIANGLGAAEPPAAPVVSKWELPASAVKVTALAWLPDGIRLVGGDGSGTVRIWEISTGRDLAVLPPAKQGAAWIYGIDASRDGKRIAIANGAAGLRIWDRETNREVSVTPTELFAGIPHETKGLPGVDGVGFHELGITVVSSLHSIARVSTDGKLLGPAAALPIEFGKGEKAYLREEAAVAPIAKLGLAYYEGHDVDELRVWDYGKGAVAARSTLKELTRPAALAMPPDGRWAIVRDLRPANSAHLLLFDVRSLKEIGILPLGNPRPGATLRTDFSDDGRLIFVAVSDAPAKVYDVARLSPLAEPTVGYVSSVRFSPDNRRIATGHAEPRVSIHDLRAAVDPNPPKALDAAACWNDLVSADGATAMRAVYRLADRPDDAIKLFREKLKPIAKPAAEDVTKWLAALGAPAFAERQSAAKKLAVVVDAIGPELKREIDRNPSPEAVEAIRGLIDSAERARRKLDGDHLRAYRATQVLEMIGAPAWPLLDEWAAGAAGIPLTEEARRAVERGGREMKKK
jgi:WD domain, G-beta repeat